MVCTNKCSELQAIGKKEEEDYSRFLREEMKGCVLVAEQHLMLRLKLRKW